MEVAAKPGLTVYIYIIMFILTIIVLVASLYNLKTNSDYIYFF